MQAAILTENLTKVYVKRRSLREIVVRPLRAAERVPALSDVSLSVAPGEVFGLLGPNGAGKTTLLKILAGLVLPTSGRALVLGAEAGREDRAVKRSIGFVTSDERSFYWRLTGRENLEFFSRLYGLDPATSRRRTAEVIGAVDLEDKADQQCMNYSSGLKQRLAIARALLHDPPVLCLDEPTRSLDPIASKHLRAFVRDRLQRERRKTVLLATHNLQEAEEMCGNVAILDRGRVLRHGSPASITAGLPGRDHYVMTVAGLAAAPPPDARWSFRVERRDDGLARLLVEVDRGGEAFTDLLRRLVQLDGARIVSCSRREPSLQDVFDWMDAGASGQGRPRPAGAGA